MNRIIDYFGAFLGIVFALATAGLSMIGVAHVFPSIDHIVLLCALWAVVGVITFTVGIFVYASVLDGLRYLKKLWIVTRHVIKEINEGRY